MVPAGRGDPGGEVPEVAQLSGGGSGRNQRECENEEGESAGRHAPTAWASAPEVSIPGSWGSVYDTEMVTLRFLARPAGLSSAPFVFGATGLDSPCPRALIARPGSTSSSACETAAARRRESPRL
jgi:hypothetical protein